MGKRFEARAVNGSYASAIELQRAGVLEPQERARGHIAYRTGGGRNLRLR